jgi:hypothetical protein
LERTRVDGSDRLRVSDRDGLRGGSVRTTGAASVSGYAGHIRLREPQGDRRPNQPTGTPARGSGMGQLRHHGRTLRAHHAPKPMASRVPRGQPGLHDLCGDDRTARIVLPEFGRARGDRHPAAVCDTIAATCARRAEPSPGRTVSAAVRERGAAFWAVDATSLKYFNLADGRARDGFDRDRPDSLRNDVRRPEDASARRINVSLHRSPIARNAGYGSGSAAPLAASVVQHRYRDIRRKACPGRPSAEPIRWRRSGRAGCRGDRVLAIHQKEEDCDGEATG